MKTRLRIAMAQLNPTVGDYAGNGRKIISWIQKAEKNQADLIVFPELSLCGYPVWDLANKRHFLDEGKRYLQKIVSFTKGKKIAVVVGYVERETSEGRSFNTLAWIQKGRLLSKQFKRLLPTYDVFLEDIFFEPGEESHVMKCGAERIGLTICEDIWDTHYKVKPVTELIRKKANFIINISASPFYKGVMHRRDEVLRRHAVHHQVPILYVNQVGGQDDLIFDGRSTFMGPTGEVLFRAPAFKEGLYFVDWFPEQRSRPSFAAEASMREEGPDLVYQALVTGIRDYCQKNKFMKVLIGLSGGIDSALTAALAVDALGPDAVMGVTMPGEYSSKGSWLDSEELSRRLGIKCYTHPIKKKYDLLCKEFREQMKRDGFKVLTKGKVSLAMENLQARLRGLELMYLSNDLGRLLLTTGNKSELAVGYCTLYGDMAGGLAVLGDLYKTDVYRLSRYRNQQKEVIPESILTKAPSAELRPGQKDEDSLPAYDILDEILYLYIERGMGRDEIARQLKSKKVARDLIRDVVRKVDHNEYKRRQTPPILRVTEKAWFGRRMPITNQFDR